MSLSDAAKVTREHADACTDPGCHAVAHASQAAVHAESRQQLAELEPEPDLEGIPPPPLNQIQIPSRHG